MTTYIPGDVFRGELLDLLDETFENTITNLSRSKHIAV